MKILQPLLYFSIFNHPLKKEEVFSFSSIKDLKQLDEDLNVALNKNIICKTKDYYHYHQHENTIQKREEGNIKAKQALKKAKKRAKFIYRYFPYVEGVAISGSLSKGYFDSKSDADFFIITSPNKLWTCKMILTVFKKIFLLNSRKFFCINYLISTDNLEINEKNRFTATEIATLLPIHGQVFDDFFTQNNWYKNYLPNKSVNQERIETPVKNKIVSLIEKSKVSFLDEWIENTSFKVIFFIWKLKYSRKMTNEDFAIAFKSSKKVSKHHPSNFQKKVIDSLNNKYKEVKEKYLMEFPEEHV